MARALKEWSRAELAERASVHAHTVSAVEKGHDAEARTLNKIANAFEITGIVFTADGGVRPSNDWMRVIEGPDANAQVLEDIYQSLMQTGGEVLIAGLTELPLEDIEGRKKLQKHIDRLREAGITERILLRQGDYNLIAPHDWYRWLQTEEMGDTPFQLYGQRIALIEWGPPQKVILIDHPKFAATFRNLFNAVWDFAQPVPMKVQNE
jgi:transcriptional regulator with XRE-family HTH domain